MEFKKILHSKAIGWLTVILVFSIIYLIQKCQGANYIKHILNNAAFTVGVVSQVKYVTKSGEVIYYNFEVDNKTYSSTNNYGNFHSLQRFIVNKSFPVIYAKDNPADYNAVLIEPDDFSAYNVPYPDSLYWIIEHIKEDEEHR